MSKFKILAQFLFFSTETLMICKKSKILISLVLAFSVNAQIATYEDFMRTATALAELYPLDKNNAISRSVIYNIPGKTANEIYLEVNN